MRDVATGSIPAPTGVSPWGRARGWRPLASTVLLLATSVAPALGQAGRRGDVLDANTASLRQMTAVPGMTPALAATIVARRPVLSMTAFDALLAEELPADVRRRVYERLFVQVNVNTAPDDELRLIPGVDEALVGRFTEQRPYRTLAEWRRGLATAADAKTLERIEAYVLVPINLNTASDADIRSIPGMGQRMLLEFKEYRPYRSIQQFRREIGKYVDDREVARLERYVTLD